MTPREQDFFGTEAELAAWVAEANRSPVRCETTGRLFASHQDHRAFHARDASLRSRDPEYAFHARAAAAAVRAQESGIEQPRWHARLVARL